jgi:hypothetical protein
VAAFFRRDDISRQAPGIQDVKIIRGENGLKEKVLK